MSIVWGHERTSDKAWGQLTVFNLQTEVTVWNPEMGTLSWKERNKKEKEDAQKMQEKQRAPVSVLALEVRNKKASSGNLYPLISP